MALHPFEQRDLEMIREAAESDSVGRIFILIWSSRDVVRTWLDGSGALNLHTGEAVTGPDPLQRVRAFSSEGFPLDVDAWLRAYFAAGGTFHHSESNEKLVKEMKAGTKHRVQPRFREDVFELIQVRVQERAAVSSGSAWRSYISHSGG